jgi:hypothetical protein
MASEGDGDGVLPNATVDVLERSSKCVLITVIIRTMQALMTAPPPCVLTL